MMARFGSSMAGVLIAGAVGIGCGGSNGEHATPVAGTPPAVGEKAPADGPPASGPDPCALVTKTEAEDALGSAVGAPERKRGGRVCRYKSSGNDLMSVSASVTPVTPELFEGLLKSQEDSWNVKRVPEPSLGDQAFVIGRQVSALKDGNMIAVILVSGDSLEDAQTKVKGLASKALPRAR